MDALTVIVVSSYALASVLYFAYHAAPGAALARTARLLLALGFVVQIVDIALHCLRGAHPASSGAEALVFIAWLMAGGYLIATVRYRLEAGGAFAVPAALVLLLLARVVPAASGPGSPAAIGTLGLVHVFLAMLGVALFALAAVIEGLYLVQERRLKRKELGRLRAGGGVPLDLLDRLAARCVSVGFPVFTLAIVTGTVWIARLGVLRGGGMVRPEYVLAVASWVAFGVLLVARAGAGWQGRRAAWLTVGGVFGVLLAALGYVIRTVA